MEEKVLTYIKERQLIQKGSTILVAVSGGPDSLALLHFLWSHQNKLDVSLSVITIDHQLRSDISAADAQFVADTCRLWNIPCKIINVDVDAYRTTHKTGTQLAARELRYEAFRKLMEQENVDYLAFGHHADDQIETVLMALLKTSHVHNLAGMPRKRPFAGGELIRPFLCVEKKEIMEYNIKHALTPRVDETNAEKNYMRNRLRADILPLLKRENPNLSVTIDKLTENIRDDSAFLMDEAKKAFSSCVHVLDNQKKAVIKVTLLQTYSLSLQRKVYQLILSYLYDGVLPEKLSYRHEEMFLTLLKKHENRMINFPRGMIAERIYDKIYAYFPMRKEQKFETQLLSHVPATLDLQDGTILKCTTISAEEVADKRHDPYTYIGSEKAICFPLTLRSIFAGDRMSYDGLSGTKKVQRIFIDEKVPKQKRNSWPILTDARGEILWVIGLRKNTKITPQHARYICIEIEQPSH